MTNWIESNKPALVLAPMEGVTDSPMRALYSERGGFNFCVAEFLRISHELLPPEVYLRHVPELETDCKTPSGMPVQIQLLGGDPELMAASAARAFDLGARAVDINFGCPAPLVNRHDGGAALLKCPERIKKIVEAVRQALPSEIPVSAKLRLGWDNVDSIFLNASMAALGGASWITIHARTKAQGYAPPVNWKVVGDVRKTLDIPVVANGDIWTFNDFLRCLDETGCRHFMLGRGAMADPSLASAIARELGISSKGQVSETAADSLNGRVSHWMPLLKRFAVLCEPVSTSPSYVVCRIKQWLKMAAHKNSITWFDQIKTAKTVDEIWKILETQA